MPWTNYHSHTRYCDGTDIPDKYVAQAISQGLAVYGFSSHAPVPFALDWAMDDDKVPDYLEEIESLKKRYADQIEIYAGMEVDYIPGKIGVKDYFIANLGLDYTIGSVHFVDGFENGKPWVIDNTTHKFEYGLHRIFDNDIQKAVSRYYELIREMVRNEPPDVVGHLDKIKMHNSKKHFFDEDEVWYKDAVLETLDVIAEAGVIMEANTRGIYKKLSGEPYPSSWVWKEALKRGIPAQINSDGHHPREITSNFEEAASMLNSVGYSSVRILYQNKWQDKPFTSRGIEV